MFKPPNFSKKNASEIDFLSLGPGQQYFSVDIRISVEMASWKIDICLEKSWKFTKIVEIISTSSKTCLSYLFYNEIYSKESFGSTIQFLPLSI